MDSWNQVKQIFVNISIYDMLDEIFSISRVQDEVIRLNHEQLQSGIDSNDKVINTIGGSPYRPYTVVIKKAKGQPSNVVTLYDTGEFYNSFRVKILNNGYEIIADFTKGEEDIRDNFTSDYDFLGLTEESLTQLVYETILPRLTKMINQKLDVKLS